MGVHMKWAIATLAMIAGAVALTLVVVPKPQPVVAGPAPKASDETVHVVIAYSQPLTSTLGPAKIGDQQQRLLNAKDLRTPDGKRIDVTLVGLTSKEMIERVMNGTLKAHAIIPSSEIYLDLANEEWSLRTDEPLVKKERVTLLYQPYVLAVQRPMAEAMGWPAKEIGWSDVAEIARNGWKSVGHPEWGQLKLLDANYQGHDANLQMVVSIAQSVLGGAKELTADRLKDPVLAETYKTLDSATVWFPTSLENLVQYDAQDIAPPCHMAFVPEHIVIDLNDRRARLKAPPAWVAIYPKGGTIVEGVTAGIVEREWATEEQQQAAAAVIQSARAPEIQQRVIARGYRPALPGISKAPPIDKAWGVDPKAATEHNGMPSADMALNCQDVWQKASEVKSGGGTAIKSVADTSTVDPAVARKTATTNTKGSRVTPLVLCVRKSKQSAVSVVRTVGTREVNGSGVIVDPRGYLVTNAHVVADAKVVNIRILSDPDKVLNGVVILSRPDKDMALVRISEPGEYQAVEFTDSDGVEVGEQAVAIGNPFGYKGTVTLGIISARDREIQMPSGSTLTKLLQTDAPINPGNSGGPLVTIDGELLGLNVAIRESAQNIGFAIPSNHVRDFKTATIPK